MVEFESAEGSLQRLSIYEPLVMVSKEDWEASLPKEAFEVEKKVDETPKTPASTGKFLGKKGKKI